MKKKKIAVLSIIIVVIAAIIIFAVSRDDVSDFHEKYAGYDLTSEAEETNSKTTYAQYLSHYEATASTTKDVDVDLFAYTQGEDVETMTDYAEEEKVLYTGEDSSVTWEVNVEESGLYNVYLEYYTVESRGVDIERKIYINGELPFTGADTLTFSRLWTDSTEVRTDNQGNEIRPSQTETYAWQSAYCKDNMGYIVDPYQFYLEKGNNTITLEAISEPMVLRKLIVKAINDVTSYEDYIAAHPDITMSETALNYSQKIQGEDSTVRSDPSLYAKYDRSSPSTEPYSITNTVLNYVGGETWKTAGQWIQWDMEVPEDGYYYITIKGRQNYQRGSISCRSLYIDDKIPFKEVETIGFEYNNQWNTMTLSDEEGTPYKFYLTGGTHTVRLEVTLGELGDVLNRLQDSVLRMNSMYRKILILTGPTPDKFRDYEIDKVYPDVVDAMGLEAKRLYQIVDDFVAYSGQLSDKIATASTLANQLERFNRRPAKIPKTLQNYKDNITSLGTSIQTMSESKLDIDYIIVSGEDASVEKNHESFLARAWHEVKSFVASFIVDYNAVGDVYDEDDAEVIKVWILTGRDQSSIVKAMVDDTFVPETGIKVNVELVAQEALLNAVISGNGPDVVLSVLNTQPVNYALRNAVEDLTQFDDFDETVGVFYESALTPFRYEGGVYAIPETQNYNVLFYRKDVLEEDLGLEVPQTWDELIGMLPTIQGKNMSVAIPSTERKIANVQNPDLSLFFSLVYQNGGTIYDDNNMSTVVDEEADVNAFETYTRFFTNYGLPKEYDFPSRFRSGEMPIGIADYTTYNTLIVSAPEIKGLWDFTLLPGTEVTDAEGNTYIDRSNHCWGSCSMMIKTDNETTKQNAWEFMKWWAKTETQVRFGREIESILGSSARYATANPEAFEQLSWSSAQIDVLKEQWSWAVGFREIAGGYYTSQHLTNAARKVMNDKDDPRETLLDYARTINDEIKRKREEFDLPVK